MKSPPLQSFRVENFKAIQDSDRVKFDWLTVFIGNNGSGKSSLVEALETFRDVVLNGVDHAFRRWRGFEHVWNKARERKVVERKGHRTAFNHPMRFRFDWKLPSKNLIGQQSISQGPGGNSLFIQMEQLIQRRKDSTDRWTRSDSGKVYYQAAGPGRKQSDESRSLELDDGQSMLERYAWQAFDRWQFLMLDPERMGQPIPQQRTFKNVRLARDASNVAEYLNEVRELDRTAFDGILEAVQYVLPYAADLQPTLTSEIERAFYLNLKEGTFEVPGWLLSSGTLRIVALLAVLRHPQPPPLLVIEEIENGLDPRTVHMIVEEIRAAITTGRTQVILTTHSPYLLDLLDLSQIVVVEREDDQTVFRRPDEKQLANWSKSFSPGRLYTMGRLTKEDR